jgi:hypothetical protein
MKSSVIINDWMKRNVYIDQACHSIQERYGIFPHTLTMNSYTHYLIHLAIANTEGAEDNCVTVNEEGKQIELPSGEPFFLEEFNGGAYLLTIEIDDDAGIEDLEYQFETDDLNEQDFENQLTMMLWWSGIGPAEEDW